MLRTTTNTTFVSEAAQAPSLPNRRMLVGNTCRIGWAIALTGRRAG